MRFRLVRSPACGRPRRWCGAAGVLLVVLSGNIAFIQETSARGGFKPMSKDTAKQAPDGISTGPGGLYEEAAMPYTPEESATGSGGRSAIGAVCARNELTLMAIDGVLGVGVGRTLTGDDAIVLFIRNASVKRRVPARVEGYPVETTLTGEIDAYRPGKP